MRTLLALGICAGFTLSHLALGAETKATLPNSPPVSTAVSTMPGSASLSIVDEIPTLQKYIYSEPESKIAFGFGISPLAIIKNRVGFTANIFQIHLVTKSWDWEIFSASFGNTISDSTGTNVRTYTFRSIPKFRITNTLSFGPIVGLEFVNFPDVSAELFKGNLFTKPNPFSAVGAIYGLSFSENLKWGKDYQFKINQLAYRQNYSTVGTNNGWQYFFLNRDDLNADPTPISAGWVFAFEFSFLY